MPAIVQKYLAVAYGIDLRTGKKVSLTGHPWTAYSEAEQDVEHLLVEATSKDIQGSYAQVEKRFYLEGHVTDPPDGTLALE